MPTAPTRAPIARSLHRPSRACTRRLSSVFSPVTTPACPARAQTGRIEASTPAPATALDTRARKARGRWGPGTTSRTPAPAAGRREPNHVLGEGPMLGAADDRHVRARARGLYQAEGRLTAPGRRGDIEDAASDVLRKGLGGCPSGVGAATDEREIAAGTQEPAGRAGHAPGVNDGAHLEVV